MSLKGEHLLHAQSGFRFLPQIAEFYHEEGSGIRTVSTMQFDHPNLIPEGAFEFQHSTGNTIVEALAQGIDLWLQTDLTPLLDALEKKPKVLRNAEGVAQSDCRVNGLDWPTGKLALEKYAATWRPAGYECRKQYVILHTLADENAIK